MSIARKWINDPVEALLTLTNVRKVTHIISARLTVVAARRHKYSTRTEIVVTIGKPNYESRKMIKACKKAREPFPVEKYHFYAKRKRHAS